MAFHFFFKYRFDIFIMLPGCFSLLLYLRETSLHHWTFKFLKRGTNKKKMKKKIKLTRKNQSRCVLIHVLCSALVFAFVFINVGKRFIIVHGNYVECSRLYFFSLYYFFVKSLLFRKRPPWFYTLACYVNHFYLHRDEHKKMRLKSIGQKKRDMYHFVNVCKKFF